MQAVFFPAVRCGRCGHEGVGASADEWWNAIAGHQQTAWFSTECHQCGWSGDSELIVQLAKPYIIRFPKEDEL